MANGDELYIRIIKTEHLAKTTVAQQLAEQAADKTVRTWDQIVPSQYHQHAKVFSETAAHRFPDSWEWDHAIDLKANAPSTLDCKVYPLSPGEDVALQTFLSENLAKGYIHPSKSPYAFPFFFIKKKNGDLRPVQDYHRLNAFTIQNTAPLPLIQELMDHLTSVTILPFALSFLLLIPCSSSFALPLLLLFLSFATSTAALGCYAYPIRSHIVLMLMSSSSPLCHIALLLPLSPEHSILFLLTDDPVTFYDTPWYSGSCALPSSTFYAFLLLSNVSCTFYHVLLSSPWIS